MGRGGADDGETITQHSTVMSSMRRDGLPQLETRRDPFGVMATARIILFDDMCTLCSKYVQLVITRDSKGVFKFASLQSETGQQLRRRHGMDPEHITTMVLIEGNQIFTQSDAALRIARHLDGLWKAAVVLWVFPRPIRNWVYQLVARNRYRWFGKRETCWLPSPTVESRFLDKSAVALLDGLFDHPVRDRSG